MGSRGEVACDRVWVTFLCMADQSSAADEYVLLQEVTAPLTMLPDDPVAVAADVHFPVVLRGYDRPAVDAYVKRTRQLVAELEATRSPEAAIPQPMRGSGEQISGILQLAHDTAGQIIARARSRPRTGSRSPIRRLRRSRPWGSSGGGIWTPTPTGSGPSGSGSGRGRRARLAWPADRAGGVRD